MFVFSFLGNSQSQIDLAIVAPPGHSAIVRALSQSPVFHIERMGQASALKAVKRGTLAGALIIPPSSPHHTARLTLRITPMPSRPNRS
jgi:hypothetical protein